MVDVERENYSILFSPLIIVKNGQFSEENSSHSDSTSNRPKIGKGSGLSKF